MVLDAEPDVLGLEEVGFSFPRGPKIFDGVDLALRSGQRIALLGANGSGKTTLLRILVGLTKPSTGTVRLDGTALTGSRADRTRLRTRVQMVLQEPDDQIVAATVRADVSFGPTNLGLGREEVVARVDDAMAAGEQAGIAQMMVDPIQHPGRSLCRCDRRPLVGDGAAVRGGGVEMRRRPHLLQQAVPGKRQRATVDAVKRELNAGRTCI